ncbi:hypothetical protein APS67_001823 [Streptomyces sp. AVP053U2]|nr:hypothetical protein APS67_001823 [Streptomyces sp. AVP053U2]
MTTPSPGPHLNGDSDGHIPAGTDKTANAGPASGGPGPHRPEAPS